GTFAERDGGLGAADPLAFAGYPARLAAARRQAGRREAILTGTARIGGHRVALGVFDLAFLGGSMGTGGGERVTRLGRHARAARDRADASSEAATGVAAGGVPARARHARPHRAAAGAARDARRAARAARMTASAYEDTLAYLTGLEVSAGWDLKLERMRAALERRGHPEARFPAIHVAGTNGKGSAAAMLDAVLAASGYRTGLYTSPHLVDFTERI